MVIEKKRIGKVGRRVWGHNVETERGRRVVEVDQEKREREGERCAFLFVFETVEAVSSVTFGDGTGESDPSTEKGPAKIHRNLWIREPLR